MAHLTQTKPPTAAEDALLRVRILIEAAMKEAQFAGADAQLVVRQLAAELVAMNAALSDVRMVVQELYGGEQVGAEAYLAYLAENGYPVPLKTPAEASPVLEQMMQAQSTLPIDTTQLSDGSYSLDNTLNSISLYPGNLINELVANSAYSALIFGERRSGTSALLRAIAYEQLNKCADTVLDILDCYSATWGGLEGVRTDGESLVTTLALSTYEDIEELRLRLAKVAAEIKRRQHLLRSESLSLTPPTLSPYLFLIDGLSEVHGALPGWSADRRSKDAMLSSAASYLRFILGHGPTVSVTCVATAREHSRCLCDATALGETRLLFLGRISSGRNGGYRAIDRAIEDKELLPSPADRTRYRAVMAALKQVAQPVIFTPNGVPRLGALGDFSGYLSLDLLSHYQTCLEMGKRGAV